MVRCSHGARQVQDAEPQVSMLASTVLISALERFLRPSLRISLQGAGQERLAKLMEKQRRPLPQDFMQLDGVPGQRPYHSLQSSPFRSDAKDMPPTLLQNPRAVQAQCGCADCQRHVSAMGSFGDQGLRGMPREGVPLVQGLR
eukprot:g743.t1